MAKATAGYSGTPLPKKLGIKEGQNAALIAVPRALLPVINSPGFAAVQVVDGPEAIAGQGRLDFVMFFTKSHDELVGALSDLQDRLAAAGMIWVAWPKRASKVATDVTEDVVRAQALRLDLVDIKVCAVDQVWSGLKLVIRKERRAGR